VEALLGPILDVDATRESLGGDPTLAFDEWRALVRCRDGLANLQLSWNARPLRTEILVQGTGGARRADVLPVFFPKASAAWTGPLDRVTSALAGALEPLAPESATSVFSEDPSSRADAGIEPLVAAF